MVFAKGTLVNKLQTTIINHKQLHTINYCTYITNVPLAETIEIYTKTFYDGHLPTPVIPKHVFIELMKTATTSVEFSFNNIMYRQIDEVAMGSPLGPALANIFVGYYESKLFNKISKPTVYGTVVTLMTPFSFSQRN